MKIKVYLRKLELKEVMKTVTTIDVSRPIFGPPDANGTRIGPFSLVKNQEKRWALLTDKPLLVACAIQAIEGLSKRPECTNNRVYLKDEKQGRRVLKALTN
ncbi:MAG: hypothetical protein JRN68_03270 [Nitrososphaerota archaeon]|nr:hypothetical protein [Ferrimicrobium acidiphilum]MDG6933698.1 hypothetical protein [Nitrososphaerota archaeon]